MKILVIKTSSLGDIIHTYPVIDYLRKKFPDAQLDWVVEAPYADLVTAHPMIDNTFLVSTKSWRKAPFSRQTWQSIKAFRQQLQQIDYDVVFDLQGNLKSAFILSQVKSRAKVGFGRSTVPEWPNLLFTNHRFDAPPGHNIRMDYLSIVKQFFGDKTPTALQEVNLKITQEQKNVIDILLQQPTLRKGAKVVICPGSAWPNKQLTEEALQELLMLLQQKFHCCYLFVWGTSAEQAMAQRLQKLFPESSSIVDKMPLPALQNLIKSCDYVIAMDSLPLHLAGTTTTPSFSIFGASLAEKYRPLGEQHQSFQGTCPYGRSFDKRCPVLRTCPTGACIRSLLGSRICAVVEQYFPF